MRQATMDFRGGQPFQCVEVAFISTFNFRFSKFDVIP